MNELLEPSLASFVCDREYVSVNLLEEEEEPLNPFGKRIFDKKLRKSAIWIKDE